MFSDLGCSTLPCDIPCPLDTHADEDPLAPLNFDDLLDIAREFEFTRTITHIWPCEEPSAYPEMGLEDIFAAIAPMPNAEESPLPLPSSTLPMPLDPVPLQEVDLRPAPEEHARISEDPVPLPKDDDQVRTEVEYPITPILQGWSPPDGSQFLDLDDSHMFPPSAKDMWISPWFATFLVPSNIQPTASISQSSATTGATDDVLPQTLATEPKAPPISTIDEAVDDPRRNTAPFVPLPGCAILEPGRAGSALQANANVRSQVVITPHTKTPKSRGHLSSGPGPSTVGYAKAPRGGIPPHIARTVTKAHILRIEKERKVMQDAFSSTAMGEGKKPSVLRRAVRAERLCGGGSGKKLFDCGDDDEKGGKAAKRARV